jgi:transposase
MNRIELEIDIKNGMSSYEIANKYNKGQSTISYWIKKFNLKTKYNKIGNGYYPPNVRRFKKNGSIYEKINWKYCQDLSNSGKTWKDICSIMNLSNNALHWGVKNNKLKLRTAGESRKLSHKNGKYDYSVYRTEEHRKKQSKFGGLKEKSGRCKKYLYTKKDGTNVWLQGSWELALAVFFDEKNIQWDKNKNGFPYKFENKDRKYYPDFYVLGKYIEVKGYQTNQDIEKWKQFQYPLIILKKEGMKDLDTWYQQNFLKS